MSTTVANLIRISSTDMAVLRDPPKANQYMEEVEKKAYTEETSEIREDP